MVKINEFHVGKNDVNVRGDWTLICPEKDKKEKKMTFTGFDLGTSRFQEQNTATELQRHLTQDAFKELTNSCTYNTVVANFSQFPPFCAIPHLYTPNVNIITHIFY